MATFFLYLFNATMIFYNLFDINFIRNLRFKYDNPADLAINQMIRKVTFEIDSNGILNVGAEDKGARAFRLCARWPRWKPRVEIGLWTVYGMQTTIVS